MARPLRIEFPGAVYHVTSRGNARERIFHGERDNQIFLEILGNAIGRYSWLCYAYCLMENHYHLIIETPEPNLSKGMQYLNGAYTQAHHRRHQTVGHLLQGRFKSIIVDKEHYLLEPARYVALNPVRAGIAGNPQEWPWSSYSATAGLKPAPPYLQIAPILHCFDSRLEEARQSYRTFVLAGINKESPWKKLKSQVILGSEEFIEQVKPSLTPEPQAEKFPSREIPKSQRFALHPSLPEIFGERKSKKKRDEAIVESYIVHGYTQSDIADFLGIHYTTVSRAIHREHTKKKIVPPAKHQRHTGESRYPDRSPEPSPDRDSRTHQCNDFMQKR
jgi:putative transposase